MKKLLSVLLAAMMICTVALAETGLELFTRWETDGYPEDVTGVFYNVETENIAILLTNAGEARQKAIKDSLSDGKSVMIYEGTYSHKELMQVQSEIETMMGDSSEITGVGIGWGPDGVGFGSNGKDFRVCVSAMGENVDKVSAELSERFGDIVAVFGEQESITADVPVETKPEGLSDWGIIGIAAAVVAVIILLLTFLPKKKEKTMSRLKMY